MTPEQLLQPRYLVIADYPKSIYKVGEVLNTGRHGDILFCDDNGPRMSQYPHLFRRLEWWEHRKPEGMPGYVKFQEKVYKVIRYRKPNIIRIIDDFWKTEIWQEIGEPYWLPATAEEYEQFTHPAPLGDKQ